MTGDIDIYRSAKLLIDQFGVTEAEIHAAQRADELLAAGDMDGRGVWLRVVDAVKELSEAGPPLDGAVRQPCVIPVKSCMDVGRLTAIAAKTFHFYL